MNNIAGAGGVCVRKGKCNSLLGVVFLLGKREPVFVEHIKKTFIKARNKAGT